MNRLDGDAAGPVKVLVSNPVYSHDNQHVLIPEGTIVLGEARKVGGSGFGQQRRMTVAFHRTRQAHGELSQFALHELRVGASVVGADAPSQNTYGNAGDWLNSVNKYTGKASTAIQGASVSRVAQMTGYETLDAQGQKVVAAQTATLDLGDSVDATNLQAIGTIRANQTARQTEITNLEAASHSLDPNQQTEMATLQRINQALLLLLRTQQDESQLSQGQTLQQMVQDKQSQDELKLLFQAAQGYETNYQFQVTSSAQGVQEATSY